VSKTEKRSSEAVASKVTKSVGKPANDQPAGERNGPKGPEPTRFGDWEKDGRCYDF
jgi:hypothetical protein